MNKLKITISSLLCGALLSACGGGSSSNNSADTTEPQTPEPRPSGSLIQPQQIDDAYVSQYTDLAVHADGHWCFIERHAQQTDSYRAGSAWEQGWQNSLTCHSGEQQTWHYQPDEGIALVDIEFTDSQQLILIEAVKNNDSPHELFDNELRFSRYSISGDLQHQRWFTHTPNEQDKLYYDVSDGEIIVSELTFLSDNNRPQFPDSSVVQLIQKNGQLYLLLHSYGVQVYQLNADFDINWSHQVMPAYTWLWFWSGSLANHSEFAVNDNGEVVVAFELFGNDTAIYNQHFSAQYPNLGNNGDIALTVLNPSGELQHQHLIGQADVTDQLVRVFWQNDALTLVGHALHNKENAAGGTFEWDAFAYQVDPVSGTTISSKVLHYDQEDRVFDAAISPSGQLWLGGKSGYIQVDSNSQTSYGHAVILEVGEQGQLTERAQLELPRDSSITQLFWLENHLYYRYDFDGSITHTCDNDNTLCWQKSGIGSLAL
ncbi:hypothetical protein CHH28_02240 [Bacterioplanes sanyensis]|uniref:Ricin B lectin domain-containing protein n=1 Tax=Bacterioplanes sanyensis TaxID=1249553 RepID=A0A222FGD8_9GAMM|nr:hypothetical protein [Bacterioplanes sanyensis]ASP37564.1 hypothetical protein CHH28_02240 [Bacterioplanes sanyensis]